MKTNFLKTVIHYYDRNKIKYYDIVSNIDKIDIVPNSNDMEHNIMKLYDSDGNLLIESRFEFLGYYNNSTQTWIWAWAVPSLSKNTKNISTNLLKYGLDLDNRQKILKNEFINSRFQITSNMQLETHIALSSYISRVPMVIELYYTVEVNQNFITKQKLDEYLKQSGKKNIFYMKYYVYILDHDNLKLY